MDGLPNEKVVAIGIHYYSNENVTTQKLGLRDNYRNEATWSTPSGEFPTIETLLE